MSNKKSAVIATFNTHVEAEQAVKELQKSGFDMKQLSIVGKDYHSDEHVVGYYNMGERTKYWGKNGAFWGGIWGLLFGSALLLVPGLGPVVVAGPLVASIIAGLETAVVVGGLSAIGAALYSMGIPKDSIVLYETSLSAGKFLLLSQGAAADIEKAHKLLEPAADSADLHHELTQEAK